MTTYCEILIDVFVRNATFLTAVPRISRSVSFGSSRRGVISVRLEQPIKDSVVRFLSAVIHAIFLSAGIFPFGLGFVVPLQLATIDNDVSQVILAIGLKSVISGMPDNVR